MLTFRSVTCHNIRKLQLNKKSERSEEVRDRIESTVRSKLERGSFMSASESNPLKANMRFCFGHQNLLLPNSHARWLYAGFLRLNASSY